MDEENTSLWSKKTPDLTVGDQMKIMVIAPALAVGTIIVPLVVIGWIGEIRDRRKLKKNPVDLVEEVTTEEQ